MRVRKKRRLGPMLACGGAILIGATAVVYFFSNGKDAAAQTAETSENSGPPPAPVAIAQALETRLAPLAEAPGSAISVADSLVASATNGKIEWIAEIGDEVAEGDVIARIDPADAQFALNEARADVGRLKARADYLSRQFDRFDGLGPDAGESESVIDEMRANRDEAVQNLARARVALKRAETNLERTEIKAPFTGKIATREIEVGEFSNVGSPIARLVDTTHMEVTARAPASLLANTKAGDLVDVQYDAEIVQATVRALVPVGDDVSRTLELRLSLPETGWPIGAPVRVKLAAAAPRLTVAAHRDSLVIRTDRISIFKIDAENVAHRIDVETGAADGDLIEIIGDVAAGDRLVVRGAERLRDGQSVEVQDRPGESSTSLAGRQQSAT